VRIKLLVIQNVGLRESEHGIQQAMQRLNAGLEGLTAATLQLFNRKGGRFVPNKLVELIRQQAGITLNYYVTQ